MTPEGAKAMVGTEFVYKYKDGDTVPAYVKKFDPEVGLTCMTLATESAQGYKGRRPEPDGTWCVVAFDFRVWDRQQKLGEALALLTAIKKTGEFGAHPSAVTTGGGPKCSFM